MSDSVSVRRLIWKEWRESIWILAVGLAVIIIISLSALIKFPTPSSAETDKSIYIFFVLFFFWPAFISLIGADRFSSEGSAGTLPYLLSLPVPRIRIWLIKLAVALFSASALVAATLVMNPFLLEWIGQIEHVWHLIPLSIACLFILFLSSFNASILIRNPLAAAFAGLAGLGLYAVVFETLYALVAGELLRVLTWSITIQFFSLHAFLVTLILVLLGTSLWSLSSLSAFASKGRRARQGALVFAVALILPLLLQLAVNMQAFSFTDKDHLWIGYHSSVPDSEEVVFTLRNRYGNSRLCAVKATGGPVRTLYTKPASHPSLAPGGRLVLFNPGGDISSRYDLPSGDPSLGFIVKLIHRLRVMQWPSTSHGPPRPSNITDRLALHHLDEGKTQLVHVGSTGDGRWIAVGPYPIFWMPNGTGFCADAFGGPDIFSSGWVLVRIHEEISFQAVPPAVPEQTFSYPLGWSDDGAELYYCAYRRRDEKFPQDRLPRYEKLLCAFNLHEREGRILYRAGGRRIVGFSPTARLVYLREPSTPVAHLRKSNLLVVSLESGEERTIKAFEEGDVRERDILVQKKKGGAVFVVKTSGDELASLILYAPQSDTLSLLLNAPLLWPLGISPDEGWVVFQRSDGKSSQYSLCSLDLVSRKEVVLTEVSGLMGPLSLSWAKESTVIFRKSSNELWSARLDGTRLTRLFPEEQDLLR